MSLTEVTIEYGNKFSGDVFSLHQLGEANLFIDQKAIGKGAEASVHALLGYDGAAMKTTNLVVKVYRTLTEDLFYDDVRDHEENRLVELSKLPMNRLFTLADDDNFLANFPDYTAAATCYKKLAEVGLEDTMIEPIGAMVTEIDGQVVELMIMENGGTGNLLNTKLANLTPDQLNNAMDSLERAFRAVVYLNEAQKFRHRDIKPGNFVIDEAGNVRLTDFTPHRRGIIIASPSYAAPEVYDNIEAEQESVSADIFSLWATLAKIALNIEGTPVNERGINVSDMPKKIQELPTDASDLHHDYENNLEKHLFGLYSNNQWEVPVNLKEQVSVFSELLRVALTKDVGKRYQENILPFAVATRLLKGMYSPTHYNAGILQLAMAIIKRDYQYSEEVSREETLEFMSYLIL